MTAATFDLQVNLLAIAGEAATDGRVRIEPLANEAGTYPVIDPDNGNVYTAQTYELGRTGTRTLTLPNPADMLPAGYQYRATVSYSEDGSRWRTSLPPVTFTVPEDAVTLQYGELVDTAFVPPEFIPPLLAARDEAVAAATAADEDAAAADAARILAEAAAAAATAPTIEQMTAFAPVTWQTDARVDNFAMLGSYSAPNIIPSAQSHFTADVAGWAAADANTDVSWEPATGFKTPGRLVITHTGPAGTPSVAHSDWYSVTELLTYADLFSISPNTTARNVTPTLEWADDALASKGTTVLPLVAERAGTYQTLTAIGAAPTGATKVRISVSVANNNVGEKHYIDEHYLRLGVDRVYAQHVKTGNIICYNEGSKFPGLDGWVSLPALPAPQQIYKVVQALNGDVIALSKTGSTLNLYHLPLGASSWSVAQAIGAGVSALYRSLDVNPVTGEILYSEYADPGVTTFNIWSSQGNGAPGTWGKVETWVGFAGHIHGIRFDTYVAGRVWVLMGDNDAVANVRYTDNLHAGIGAVPWQVVDKGGQHARAVDILFTETHVLWAGDTPDQAQQRLYKVDRAVLAAAIAAGGYTEHVADYPGLVEEIASDMELTQFYAAIDAEERWLWVGGTRTDVDGYQQLRAWAGRVDQVGRTAQVSIPPLLGAVRLDAYVDGPDSYGNMHLCYVNRGVASNTAMLLRGHLLDGSPSEVRPLQMVDRQLVADPSFMRVGPWPGTDDFITTVANRLLLWPWDPPVDMPMGTVQLKIGSVIGGKLQVLILQPDAKDRWQTILALSTADTLALVNSVQTFTLDTKPPALRSRRPVLGIWADTSGMKIRGGDAGILSANHCRSISGVAGPITRATILNDTKQSINAAATALVGP